MEKNIFEIATRKKYRFPYKGQITVEDLWDLSVEELDSIFKTLNAKNKVQKEESLLDSAEKKDITLETQIEIIKHIVSVKLGEAEAAKNRAAKKAEKEKLLAILANKQEEDLRGKSVEELQAMIANLD